MLCKTFTDGTFGNSSATEAILFGLDCFDLNDNVNKISIS